MFGGCQPGLEKHDYRDMILPWSHHGEYGSPWSYHVIAWSSFLTMAVNKGAAFRLSSQIFQYKKFSSKIKESQGTKNTLRKTKSFFHMNRKVRKEPLNVKRSKENYETIHARQCLFVKKTELYDVLPNTCPQTPGKILYFWLKGSKNEVFCLELDNFNFRRGPFWEHLQILHDSLR